MKKPTKLSKGLRFSLHKPVSITHIALGFVITFLMAISKDYSFVSRFSYKILLLTAVIWIIGAFFEYENNNEDEGKH